MGFFQISGHGIPQEIIDAQFDNGKSYLALPETVKRNFEFQTETYTGWQVDSVPDCKLHSDSALTCV